MNEVGRIYVILRAALSFTKGSPCCAVESRILLTVTAPSTRALSEGWFVNSVFTIVYYDNIKFYNNIITYYYYFIYVLIKGGIIKVI